MRLIDADALLKKGKYMYGFGKNKYVSEHDIAACPTIETEPKRGRWVPFHSEAAGDSQYCSYCGVGFAHRTDFCPHCGSDMREVEDG